MGDPNTDVVIRDLFRRSFPRIQQNSVFDQIPAEIKQVITGLPLEFKRELDSIVVSTLREIADKAGLYSQTPWYEEKIRLGLDPLKGD